MATLEIDLAPDEQAHLEQQAQQADLAIPDWVRRRIFDTDVSTKLSVTITMDDGEVFEIPDLPADVGRATAIASEAVLARFWNNSPFAEIKPPTPNEKSLRPFGLCAGEFVVPDDFDDPLPEDVLKDFEGG